MKNKIIYSLLLLLAASCTTRNKIAQSKANTIQSSKRSQNIKLKTLSTQHYQDNTDSLSTSNWLKIYPKGTVTINQQGFLGNADSLIWWTNSLNTRKNKQVKKQVHTKIDGEATLEKQQIKNLQQNNQFVKATFPWPLLISILILIILYNAYRKYIKLK